MKGHFVPEFFLRRFRAAGGNLWVYFHEGGWKRRGSRDTAAEQDYYSPELEEAYHKIETSAANVLDKTIYKREAPNGDEREVLAYFLALLEQRTPTFLDHLSKPLSQAMHMLTSMYHQHYMQNPAEFEKLKQEMAAEDNALPEWFTPEHMDPRAFRIAPTKDFVFGMGFKAAQTSARILNAMTWNFFTTSEEAPFITSDNPFVYSTVVNGESIDAGLLHRNTRVTIPLSSTVALAAEWPEGHENVFAPVDESLVRQVNRQVMLWSDKFVVAPRQDFPGADDLSKLIRA